MIKKIEPELFARIMALPKSLRFDLFEFAASASVGADQLSKIVDDLLKKPLEPAE